MSMSAPESWFKNPFVDRLQTLIDDESLRSALAVTVPPLQGLGLLPADAAADVLFTHLGQIYSPNRQGIAFAKRILATGWAYAISAYPDIGTYIRRSTSARIKVCDEPITWIATGLAGVGKSSLLDKLLRLLRDPPLYQASEHCPARRLRTGLILRVSGKPTKQSITISMADALDLEYDSNAKISDATVKRIQLELYRQGCLFIVVDESQAIANGKQAGAAFVNFVAEVRKFGLPVIVVGNYSMCHGMLAQHSQNRQRMLSDPFIMLPYPANDPDYFEHWRQYKSACGE